MLCCLGMYMKGRGQIVDFVALSTFVWILGIKLRFQICVADWPEVNVGCLSKLSPLY